MYIYVNTCQICLTHNIGIIVMGPVKSNLYFKMADLDWGARFKANKLGLLIVFSREISWGC